MSLALDPQAISTAVSRLADSIFEASVDGNIDLVGIRSRGDEVAERVFSLLKEKGANVRLGVLDISLYRDDFEHLHENPKLQSSEIDFPVDNSHIILVDDVHVANLHHIPCNMRRVPCLVRRVHHAWCAVCHAQGTCLDE